jgi:hypothetical protein
VRRGLVAEAVGLSWADQQAAALREPERVALNRADMIAKNSSPAFTQKRLRGLRARNSRVAMQKRRHQK